MLLSMGQCNLSLHIHMHVTTCVQMCKYATLIYTTLHNVLWIFSGKYYKMASQDELEAFLASPAQFVPPLSPRALPPVDLLPQRRSQAQVKAMFPKRVEIQGFCPVSYIDGKKRYVLIYMCIL